MAGVEFIDANGGGLDVRLRNRQCLTSPIMPLTTSHLDQIYSVRPDFVTCCGTREVLRELISAGVDCSNEAVGDTAVTHVRYQRVYRRLPFRLGNPSSNFIVGNDARITLCQ